MTPLELGIGYPLPWYQTYASGNKFIPARGPKQCGGAKGYCRGHGGGGGDDDDDDGDARHVKLYQGKFMDRPTVLLGKVLKNH